jgi:hypothetical protein
VAGLAGWEVLKADSSGLFEATNPLATVVLVRDQQAMRGDEPDAETIQRIVFQGVRALTGKTGDAGAWFQFVRPADVLGIKFSRCGWMHVPTHQEVVDAAIAGARLAGVAQDKIMATDYDLPVSECTALVNVSSLKAHPLTGFAAAIKNYINFDEKPDQYHDAGCRRLGEIWTRDEVKGKTRLVVLDLLTPYFGTGPQIDPKADYGGILVATDPVAADAVALALCQKLRDRYKKKSWPLNPPPLFLAEAEEKYHLGTADPTKIRLVRLGWREGMLICQ